MDIFISNIRVFHLLCFIHTNPANKNYHTLLNSWTLSSLLDAVLNTVVSPAINNYGEPGNALNNVFVVVVFGLPLEKMYQINTVKVLTLITPHDHYKYNQINITINPESSIIKRERSKIYYMHNPVLQRVLLHRAGHVLEPDDIRQKKFAIL